MLLRRAAAATPSTIGHYHLRGTLGHGAFSTVFLASDTANDELCAAKIIPKRRLNTLQEKCAVKQEVAILSQLRHPAFPAIFDLYEDDVNYYIMLEYCQSGDLDNYLKMGTLSEPETRDLFHVILSAISFLHDSKISHRDIKAANILMDSNGHPKVTDFGFAIQYTDTDYSTVTCGSPYWAAPEVFRGVSYSTQKADMWSLGVLLFYLLTGRLPWADCGDRSELLKEISNGDFTIPPEISSNASSLIQKLLTVDPLQRLCCRDALDHEWFRGCSLPAAIPNSRPRVDPARVNEIFRFDEESAEPAVESARDRTPAAPAAAPVAASPSFRFSSASPAPGHLNGVFMRGAASIVKPGALRGWATADLGGQVGTMKGGGNSSRGMLGALMGPY
jgi:serine/threonine protein kinase